MWGCTVLIHDLYMHDCQPIRIEYSSRQWGVNVKAYKERIISLSLPYSGSSIRWRTLTSLLKWRAHTWSVRRKRKPQKNQRAQTLSGWIKGCRGPLPLPRAPGFSLPHLWVSAPKHPLQLILTSHNNPGSKLRCHEHGADPCVTSRRKCPWIN